MYETLITQYGGPVYFRAQMAADAGIDPMLFDALWIPSENDRTIGKQTLEETIDFPELWCFFSFFRFFYRNSDNDFLCTPILSAEPPGN